MLQVEVLKQEKYHTYYTLEADRMQNKRAAQSSSLLATSSSSCRALRLHSIVRANVGRAIRSRESRGGAASRTPLLHLLCGGDRGGSVRHGAATDHPLRVGVAAREGAREQLALMVGIDVYAWRRAAAEEQLAQLLEDEAPPVELEQREREREGDDRHRLDALALSPHLCDD